MFGFVTARLTGLEAGTIALFGAAVLGAFLGAGVVSSFNRRQVQIGMGSALLVASGLMVLSMSGQGPAPGVALGLTGAKLGIAVGISLVLGALMMLGIGFYGPGTSFGRGPEGTMLDAIRERKMPLVGDGRYDRSVTYIGHLVEACRLALLHPRAPGEVFYIADREPCTTREVVEAMAEAAQTMVDAAFKGWRAIDGFGLATLDPASRRLPPRSLRDRPSRFEPAGHRHRARRAACRLPRQRLGSAGALPTRRRYAPVKDLRDRAGQHRGTDRRGHRRRPVRYRDSQ